MTAHRVPIIATIIVIAAALTMVGLGVWQLQRKAEKEALIARYQAAASETAEVPFPVDDNATSAWFRRSRVSCGRVLELTTVSGTAASGQKGLAVRATCTEGAFGVPIMVDIGFTRELVTPAWEGGEVTGVIAPGPRLVADPPVAGLQPLAKPDPGDLPNNHLAYAGQWFFFALTALVIYVLALKRRRG
ncbi:MAG: SURF1 family cytochrome oxidase biogenesis protein [Erythrobacter sp.]|jgi:surfeit locus 1 family protein|uniref:SURF1 family cytochrome oxidase biogenesis protein n=1 Tax=Erythrobacter sp. TaxID=1042 RepID=UPI002B49F59C|nr:SURF1 family cytochrome oxidase biogenesis protein [Erythrobacter sp.]WRH70521.1 MAG: SURF1 family cytochrome oxidase biogenesis protein [Erythrobacter sp.]